MFNSLKEMKKTYMIPTLQVVKIQPAQFIATSQTAGMGGPNITDQNGFGARGAGFSDSDDWED